MNRLAIPVADLPPPGALPVMLPVPYEKQQEGNWCWAACCAMLLPFLHKLPHPQCQIASLQFGQACCTTPGISACDQGCWPENAYPQFGIAITKQAGPLTQVQLDAELSAGRAIEVYFLWAGGTGAHVALIIGKYPNGDYEVRDPWYGPGPRTLAQITSGYGQGAWTISYVSIY